MDQAERLRELVKIKKQGNVDIDNKNIEDSEYINYN